MRFRRPLLTLLLALASGHALGTTDPLRDLVRMAEAVKQLNYQGTFVYDHSGMLETMRIVHQADADGEREHLVSLDGDTRELVRDRDNVICILGDKKTLSFDRIGSYAAFPGRPNGDLDRLHGNYTLEGGGEDRVAGRTARTLVIRPRDDLRYGYRLWLDEATGLPLRSELVDGGGTALERIVFTEIEVHDRADPATAVAIRERKAQARAQVGNAVTRPDPGARRWRVEALPDGFELADYRTYLTQPPSVEVDHLVFSDGLATVSVYVEPAASDAPLSGTMRMGAVSTFATVNGQHQVVVVGDVPMPTARILAMAVRPAGAPFQ
jgi:sigma-E factor negative regulatory protein RseB